MSTVKSLLITCLFTICISVTAWSQNVKSNDVAKAAISELAALTGHWEGNGWFMKKDKSKLEYKQQTHGYFKQDSTMLILETTAKSKDRTVIDEMSIITYELQDSTYQVLTFSPNGRNSSAAATMKEGVLRWNSRASLTNQLGVTKGGALAQSIRLLRDEKPIPLSEAKLEAVKPEKAK